MCTSLFHMNICMLLQQFDQTIFEGIITLFTLNISSECVYTQVPLHFKWEFFKTLRACLLPYKDLHIIITI